MSSKKITMDYSEYRNDLQNARYKAVNVIIDELLACLNSPKRVALLKARLDQTLEESEYNETNEVTLIKKLLELCDDKQD